MRFGGRCSLPEQCCPICGGAKLIAGFMSGGEGWAGNFVPLSTRHGPGVHVGARSFRSCLGCGHLWSSLDPKLLRKFIHESRDEMARQELDELDYGTCYDLPDTEWGRMVGGYISELDALARGHQTAVLRRYREMRGVTWDVAAKEATHWRSLTRSEKLELFGWVPKTKPAKDDLGELL